MSEVSPSRNDLEAIFLKHEFSSFKWIQPSDIVVANWVRMKCIYGCSTYGECASCPPNTPPVAECREFFDEYSDIAVFHFPIAVEKPEDRKEIMAKITRKLLAMEKEVFLAGCVKAFLLPPDSCSLCTECVSSRADCKHPELSRPAPEGLAMDVFSSVRAVGYPIDVLTTYEDTMNRYAFLLVR
ncbi:MAG: DUF2284 domain-containing protein [Candidatus Thorarchaeota archaeon]|jgi:predicted metal-binding protein